MYKVEKNNCVHCGKTIKFIPEPQQLITKVLCTHCNNYSQFTYILTSK